VTLVDDSRRRAIIDSHSGYYIALMLDKANPVMPKEVHEFLHPYIQSLDERIHPPKRFWNQFLGAHEVAAPPPPPFTIR
jgi:membrane protein required for colicin V production